MAENKNKKQQPEAKPDIQTPPTQTELAQAELAEKIKTGVYRFVTADEEEDLPSSRRIILYVISAFFVLFILWANFARLDEVTRGQGRVIPSSEIQTLQSLEGGIVERFLVSEGDAVKSGQSIMLLQDIQASSDFDSKRKRYASLQSKVARLKAEAEGLATPNFPEEVMREVPASVNEEMESFRANMLSLNSQLQVQEQQLAQRKQKVEEIKTNIRDLREVIALSRQEMEMIAPLIERGSAPKVEMLQLERSMKERQSELNTSLATLPSAESAVAEIEAKINEVRSTVRAQAQTELSATLIEMNTIKDTLTALKDRKTRTDIRSPVDGTIKDIMVNTVGGVVKPGETIVEIVPKDDQLIVEARVRPQDIAFLYPGQAAVIKITAYDFSIYGGLKGNVVDISADTITDEKGETYYRVRVRADKVSLTRKDEVLPIIPGMVASVDILTGKKTVMEYILKPLIKTLDSAMTER